MSQGPTTRPTVSPSPTHLAGVPGAGLRDVTLVHSLPAGHATWLVLPGAQTQLIRNGTGPHWIHIWALAPPEPPGCSHPRTLQPLQQSPSLHMASWVRVHFLQQFPPLLAHSCRAGIAAISPRAVPAAPGAGGAAPDPAHRQRAAVALLACLHKAIATLRRVQELPGSRGGHDTNTGELLGTPEPAAAMSPPKGHHIHREWQHPQTAARLEAPPALGAQQQHLGPGRAWGHHEAPRRAPLPAVTPKGPGGPLPSGVC